MVRECVWNGFAVRQAARNSLDPIGGTGARSEVTKVFAQFFNRKRL